MIGGINVSKDGIDEHDVKWRFLCILIDLGIITHEIDEYWVGPLYEWRHK